MPNISGSAGESWTLIYSSTFNGIVRLTGGFPKGIGYVGATAPNDNTPGFSIDREGEALYIPFGEAFYLRSYQGTITVMLVPGEGGGAGGYQVYDKTTNGQPAVFTSTANRDAYFTAQPDELVSINNSSFAIGIGTVAEDPSQTNVSQWQARIEGVWVNIVATLVGPTGAPGATGSSRFFSSIAARDAFFAQPANLALLEHDLPIIVNENGKATPFYWSGEDAPAAYDSELWLAASVQTSPGSVFFGTSVNNTEDNSLSSGLRVLNYINSVGELNQIVTTTFDNTGTLKTGYFKAGPLQVFNVFTAEDQTLTGDISFANTAVAPSISRGFSVKPASSGALVARGYVTSTGAAPTVDDTQYLENVFTITPAQVGTEVQLDIPNPPLSLPGDQQLVIFSGVDLKGGDIGGGVIRPYLTANQQPVTFKNVLDQDTTFYALITDNKRVNFLRVSLSSFYVDTVNKEVSKITTTYTQSISVTTLVEVRVADSVTGDIYWLSSNSSPSSGIHEIELLRTATAIPQSSDLQLQLQMVKNGGSAKVVHIDTQLEYKGL